MNADGTYNGTSTVVSVSRVGAGRYCIELAPKINVANAVPVATLTNSAPWNSQIYIRPQASNCPNPEDTVGITTGTGTTPTDMGFDFIVP